MHIVKLSAFTALISFLLISCAHNKPEFVEVTETSPIATEPRKEISASHGLYENNEKSAKAASIEEEVKAVVAETKKQERKQQKARKAKKNKPIAKVEAKEAVIESGKNPFSREVDGDATQEKPTEVQREQLAAMEPVNASGDGGVSSLIWLLLFCALCGGGVYYIHQRKQRQDS